DFDSYQSRYAEMLARFRKAAPGASILVVAPPDRARRIGKKWVSIPAMARVVAAQREAALSSGAAFCDLYDGMGRSGSIQEWATVRGGLAGPDRVHLTTSGYRLIADALYRGIEGAYLKAVWRAIGQAVRPLFELKQPRTISPPRKRVRRIPGPWSPSKLSEPSELPELSKLSCNTPASCTLHFS